MSMPRIAALAFALFTSTASLAAFANDSPAERKSARSERPEATTGSRIVERGSNDLDEVRIVGAVRDPADAAVADDATLPELPVMVASTPRGR